MSPKKHGAFDANMIGSSVNDQLFKYEMKMQRSVENNHEYLKKKANAGAVDTNIKLA